MASRLSDCYDALDVYGGVVAALESLSAYVPAYVQLLHGDLLIEAGLAAVAVYETPCFWSGETSLAQNDAVIATEAGWVDGEEVVRTLFNPRRASRAELDAYAIREGFSPTSRAGFRADDDPQYYLARSRFRFLPLTAAQRTKINVAIPYELGPDRFLSPRQTAWLARLDLESVGRPNAYRGGIRNEWDRMAKRTTPT